MTQTHNFKQSPYRVISSSVRGRAGYAKPEILNQTTILTHTPITAIFLPIFPFSLFIPKINIAKNTEKMRREKGKKVIGVWVNFPKIVFPNHRRKCRTIKFDIFVIFSKVRHFRAIVRHFRQNEKVRH